MKVLIIHFRSAPSHGLKEPHQLVLQGRRDSMYATELEILVRELDLEGRVVFLGYIPLNHLPYLYSGATAGILVDPNDTEQIAEALLRVIEHPAFRAELCQKAIKRAALFSWA